MKYGTLARSLIALLFVVAGVQKLMNFSGTVDMIGGLGVPMPMVATAIVIFIEVIVALAFAFGYKLREAGYTLIAFTALTIVLVHRDISDQMNMLMALKNLAIIGGIMLGVCCKEKHHG